MIQKELNDKLDKLLGITPKNLCSSNKKLYKDDFMEDVFNSRIDLYNINDYPNIKKYRREVINFAEYIFDLVNYSDNFVLYFSKNRERINNICKHIYIDTDKKVELTYLDFYKHTIYYLSGMKHDLDINRFTIKREYFAEEYYLFGYNIIYNKASNNNGILYKEPNKFIDNLSKLFPYISAGFHILIVILFLTGIITFVYLTISSGVNQ